MFPHTLLMHYLLKIRGNLRSQIFIELVTVCLLLFEDIRSGPNKSLLMEFRLYLFEIIEEQCDVHFVTSLSTLMVILLLLQHIWCQETILDSFTFCLNVGMRTLQKFW